MAYQAVKETTLHFELPGTGRLKIKGVLRGTLKGPLAIMMHGRPGSGNALLQYLGARYLYDQGISTLRLLMYGFDPDTRNLLDCTLDTHVSDFEAVIANLRQQGVQQLFAIGHSYGGLTILKSTTKLEGAVLWDPSHGLWWTEDRSARYADTYPEKIVGDFVIGTAGHGWVYPAKSLRYDKQLGDTSAWAAKEYPIKIITAGKGALTDLGMRYYKAANQPKSQVVIKNAGHGFDESDSVMLELFKETENWLATRIKAGSIEPQKTD